MTTGGVLALDHRDTGPSVATPPTPTATVSPPVAQPMVNSSNDPMIASVALTPVAWGTKLDLNCSYPAAAVSYAGGTYALVVTTKNGHTERVATWNGLPGKTMHVSGATKSWIKQIASVEVTHLDGSPIAELTL